MKANLKLTAVFEEAEEGGYVAFFEELPEPKPVSTTPIASCHSLLQWN